MGRDVGQFLIDNITWHSWRYLLEMLFTLAFPCSMRPHLAVFLSSRGKYELLQLRGALERQPSSCHLFDLGHIKLMSFIMFVARCSPVRGPPKTHVEIEMTYPEFYNSIIRVLPHGK